MTQDGAPMTKRLRRPLRWAVEANAATGEHCVGWLHRAGGFGGGDAGGERVPEDPGILQDTPRLRAQMAGCDDSTGGLGWTVQRAADGAPWGKILLQGGAHDRRRCPHH